MSNEANIKMTPEASTIEAPQNPVAQIDVQIAPTQSTTVKASDLVPAREGFLATAVDAQGRPAMRLDPQTRITIGNVQLTLDRAESLGLVRNVSTMPGRYEYQIVPDAERDAKAAKNRV